MPDITPEKQLLNLIEKSKGSAGSVASGALHAETIKYQGQRLFSSQALMARLKFLRGKFKGDFSSERLGIIDVKAINRVLQVLIFILASYLVAQVSFSIITLKKDLDLAPKVEVRNEVPGSPMNSLLKATSYYLEKARTKDIFTMRSKKLSDEEGGFRKPGRIGVAEMTATLRLVGISWSGDPDAIIEDTKTQRTFFLKKGSLIDNAVKVEAIFRDKVVLSYSGEETELR